MFLRTHKWSKQVVLSKQTNKVLSFKSNSLECLQNPEINSNKSHRSWSWRKGRRQTDRQGVREDPNAPGWNETLVTMPEDSRLLLPSLGLQLPFWPFTDFASVCRIWTHLNSWISTHLNSWIWIHLNSWIWTHLNSWIWIHLNSWIWIHLSSWI